MQAREIQAAGGEGRQALQAIFLALRPGRLLGENLPRCAAVTQDS
jgi:hypothetical protein